MRALRKERNIRTFRKNRFDNPMKYMIIFVGRAGGCDAINYLQVPDFSHVIDIMLVSIALCRVFVT
jgi:hypothetical protein